MNRIALRTFVTLSFAAATGAAMAADFPAAYGELPVQPVAQAGAAAPRTASAPAKPVATGRTRADVRAELEAARCRGELPFDGETGRTYREVFPGQYPQAGCR